MALPCPERLLDTPETCAQQHQARSLSARQRQVLALLADGRSIDDMMRTLDLSRSGVTQHLKNLRYMANVKTTAQLAAKARAMLDRSQ